MHQAAVKERQSGAGHHKDQSGTDQHPGVIAGALCGLDGSFQGCDLRVEIGRGLRHRRRGKGPEDSAQQDGGSHSFSQLASGSDFI
jgi:hypothetical protein